MTKQQILEENSRLKEALKEIIEKTSEEGINHAYTVGWVNEKAMYGLYGLDYLLNPDKYKQGNIEENNPV